MIGKINASNKMVSLHEDSLIEDKRKDKAQWAHTHQNPKRQEKIDEYHS